MFGAVKNAVRPVRVTIKTRPDKNGTAREGNVSEGEGTTRFCLLIKVMTKEVDPRRTTDQNATNQPYVIKVKVLKTSVIAVTDTPPRIATNKKHSRKDTDKDFVFKGVRVRFIDSYLPLMKRRTRKFGDKASLLRPKDRSGHFLVERCNLSWQGRFRVSAVAFAK